MAGDGPRVVVLGEANGSGKTTSSRGILAEALGVLTFVNADVIAQGLSGFDPASAALEASRIMLGRLRELAGRRESFAFETTRAARSYARFLRELRDAGYQVRLYYFWLDSPDLAVARVALRVQRGGHQVPEADIRQRYGRSIRSFFTLYRPLADFWYVYDNSTHGATRPVACQEPGAGEVIFDQAAWRRFEELSK